MSVDFEVKPRYLVMVTPNNNNKYYKMTPKGVTFEVEYGRIGVNKAFMSYPIEQYEYKYNEKIKKGYRDQSEYRPPPVEIKTKSGFEIKNPDSAEIVEILRAYARDTIKRNYTVGSDAVTQGMVDAAQHVLLSLLQIEKVEDFNQSLIELFTILPRRMNSTSAFLAKAPEDYGKIITREQDLLDVMTGQIQTQAPTPTVDNNEEPEDYLDSLGLSFDKTNEKDNLAICKHLGSCANRFKRAWKVTNNSTQKRFNEYATSHDEAKSHLLWHGSRNENWWGIVNKGLILNPTNAVITGKMFGNGIYFATKAIKSLGYTSLTGSRWANGRDNVAYMALMEVLYGKTYDVYEHKGAFYNLNAERLYDLVPNADCLYAHEGAMLRADELIVYNEAQITIKYLVELKN